MPQFVDRIARAAQANFVQVFFDQRLNCLWADPGPAVTEEQGIPVFDAIFGTHCQILGDRIQARLVQIDDPFFIAFAPDAQGGIVVNHIC